MNRSHDRRRRRTLALRLLIVALVGVLLGWALPGASAGTAPVHDMTHADVGRVRTATAAAFHDQMRKLWEDHVTWTRLAIVTFAEGSDGFPVTANRLLANQVDIGNAVKPFFGDPAGARLTALLHDHITIAVEVLQAASADDAAAFASARDRWYANADDIADFLSAANPRFWPAADLRADMRTHLDQTLTQADAELHGQYAASVAAYDAVHAHILAMADLLSDGIISRFPSSFH